MRQSLLAGYAAAAAFGSPFYKSSSAPEVPIVKNHVYTCYNIQSAVSVETGVFYPGSTEYALDMVHWVPTSSEPAACSVRPGNIEDVSKIIKILGKTQTPFGIKGAGHAFNAGHSSTPGVLIAMSRFNGVKYDPRSHSVEVGMGGIWSNVYAILQAQGLIVSGGRIHGVGVGGYLLGGGFSYLTGETGLSMDNVLSYELVLPNGTITIASDYYNPDLFWGLKGGFNNFGIVTSAVLKAFPLGKIYGGERIYSGESLAKLPAAMAAYEKMQGGEEPVPKGNVILAYKLDPKASPVAILQIFHNGITPPSRFLAPFKGIPTDSDNLGVRSYTELIDITSQIFYNHLNLRSAATTVSVNKITAPIVSDFVDYVDKMVTEFADAEHAVLLFEPFTPSGILHAGCHGVFPHSIYASPLNIALWWKHPNRDADGLNVIDKAADDLQDILRAAHQPVDEMVLYPNYAGAKHSMEELYGKCLPRAKELRKKVDPDGVMLQAGGWKFT